jgi:hypothetical protein
MKTVIRNSYTPKLGDYCETIVVDKETGTAYIFDEDGVFTELDQTDVEAILARAAQYTDEQVAPLAEKLDTIEEGAQVNVIESVTQNGVPLHIIDKTVDVSVPTQTSDLINDGSDGTDTYVESAALGDYYTKTETDTQIGYETDAREIADAGLQEQIDAIVASSDVVDIVGTYAALQAYDTSKLHDNDIIKVLTDETRDEATTYYRWDSDTSTWSYIGAEGPFYTKAETDAIFTPMTRTINSKALSSDITLTAADVGALPDSTVIPTVNDATLTIQKNGTTVQTFTANQATNATANITVPTDTADLTNGAGYITSAALPTKTSDLTNDGSDGTSTYVEADDLATVATTGDYSDLTGTPTLAAVATSGDYDDLINKPTIPTVNDATLTIQKNGVDVATFTANSSTNQTANIVVPTDTSDLTNGAGFITTAALSDYYTKNETYSQQEVNSLIGAITVPTKTSDLTNDGSDGTSTYVEADDLATVATTGAYSDLIGAPGDFTGTDGQSAGTHGLVPAPTTSDVDKYLKSDGTWATVQGGGSTITTFYWNGSAMYKDSGYSTAATMSDVEAAASAGLVKIYLASFGRYEYLVSDEISNGDYFSTVWAAANGNLRSVVYTYSSNAWSRTAVNIQKELTAGTNITINNNTISAPANVSAFTNDAGYLTTAGLSNYYTKSETYSQAEVNALINAIPTYSDFTGATSGAAGANGLVPAPAAGDQDKYLKGDGTWATVQAGATILYSGSSLGSSTSIYSDSGLTTAVEGRDIKTAMDTGTVIIRDTDGNDYVVVSGDLTSGALYQAVHDNKLYKIYYEWDDDTTMSVTVTDVQPKLTAGSNINISGSTISATDTTYSDFTGATASTAGAHGLVPAPAAGDEGKALLGDGTWGDATAKLVEMSYGESNAWAKFIAAYNAGSIVYCRASSNSNPASGSQTRKAFMAYVNNAASPTSVEFQYVRSVSSKTDSQQCDQVFVYTLTNVSGGTWSVASRNMAAKVNVDSTLTKTFSNGANASMTLSAKTMTGATSGAAGTAGIVPQPAAGDDVKYLKGDGTWATIPAANNISSADWSALWQ